MQGNKSVTVIAAFTLLVIVLVGLLLRPSYQGDFDRLSDRISYLETNVAENRNEIKILESRISALEVQPQEQVGSLMVDLEPEHPNENIEKEPKSINDEESVVQENNSDLCEVNGFVRYNSKPINDVKVEYRGVNGKTFITDSSGFYRGTLNKSHYIVNLERLRKNDNNKDIVFKYPNYKNVHLINKIELRDFDITGCDLPVKLNYDIDTFDPKDRLMISCTGWSDAPDQEILHNCYIPNVALGQKQVMLKCLLDGKQYFLSGVLWGENARYKYDQVIFKLESGIPNKELSLYITKEYNLLLTLHTMNRIEHEKLELSLRYKNNINTLNAIHSICKLYWSPPDKVTYKLYSKLTGEGELQVKCFTDEEYSFTEFINIPSNGHVVVNHVW
jgi:hypothetical protein